VVTTTFSFRRLLTLSTALGLALPVFPAISFAQDASNATPPSRVGQINSLSGSVSFNGSGSGGWAAAADNYPVAAGDSIYTQDNSRAGIALDASQISLASDSELQVTGLDDQNFAATESQGEVALAINDLQPGQTYTISTPRGTVTINQNGQYDILAGDANNPTIVNVFQGEAMVSAPGASLQVTAGQAGVLSGSSQTTAQLGQAQQDSFTNAVFVQAAPPPSYAPPVVSQMTGVRELSQYGSWSQDPQYGAIWYPNVASGWAPYQDGHWAYIAPWGWTWVESESWGFAPFHYGRWVDDQNRWGWVPAPAYSAGYAPSYYQPVYAPAVVSFFGAAVGVGITAALLSSGSVGWVPLAPNEPYYPPYRASPAYIRQINIVNVRNINNVHVTNNYYYGNNFSPNQLANHRAATFVSADVMRGGEHVAGHAHAPSQDVLTGARPIDPGFGSHPAGPSAAFRLPEASRPLAEQRPGTAPRPTDFAERHALPPAIVSHAPYTGHPEGAPFHEVNGAPPVPGAPMHGAAPGPAAFEHGAPYAPEANRPSFATAPGYHPPPPPPGAGEHPGTLPPGNNFHPETANHMAPQFSHPQENAPFRPEQAPGAPGAPSEFHPQAPANHPPVEAYHPPAPAEAYHPPAPAQVFHPPVEAYHTPAPAEAYHPPAPAYHPPVEAYHPPAPAESYHPAVEAFHPPQAPAYHPPVEQFHPQPPQAPHPQPQPQQHEEKHPS
jgi:hypothetical protein